MKGTIEEQLKLEESYKYATVSKVIDDIRKRIANNKFSETDEGIKLVKMIIEPMVNKVSEYIATQQRGRGGVLKGAMLELTTNAHILAYTTISTTIDKVVRGGAKGASLTTVAYAIGARLVKNNIYYLLKDNNPKLFSYLHYVFKGATRERMAEIVLNHSEDLYTSELDNQMVVAIGTKLLELLELSGANLIQIGKSNTFSSKGSTNVVSLTKEAFSILLDIHEEVMLTISINRPPMVVPPKRWTNNYTGGYLISDSTFIKRTSYIDNEEELGRLRDVVNKVQETGWRINTRVLDTMKLVLDRNLPDPTNTTIIPKVIGGLPPSVPLKTEDLIKKEAYGKMDSDGMYYDKQDYFRYNRDREEMDVKLDAELSRRLGLRIAMSLANEVREYEDIYFPYSVDYRGRMYTETNFLTPQGPSHVKALLEFSEGQMLDDRGLYWLKVHTANSYGHDKLEYSERVAWVDNNLQAILDTGADAIVHTSFWAYADKPYEFLACCYAMYDTYNGKPVHLGVQLDATCSGIQIYSGLLLDKEGAEAVNVIGSKRNDIYQKVADKVNHYLHTGDYPKSMTFTDKEGVESTVSTVTEAKSLAGKVTRKLTKRNTMTVPYSVTLRGMYDQLREEFKDARLSGKIFWSGEEWVATKLLADLNYRAIYEVVLGARLGQEYLKDIGANLANNDNIVSYKTPFFNLQVIQRSYKTKKQQVNTYFGRLVLRNNTKEVDRRSQVNAIAPNVIHSLDAVLLQLTVEKNSTNSIGINHDCFTVLPNQGDELQRNFRHSYVELMACKPLEYIGHQLDVEVEVPSVGTLDLEEVYTAEYIIS